MIMGRKKEPHKTMCPYQVLIHHLPFPDQGCLQSHLSETCLHQHTQGKSANVAGAISLHIPSPAGLKAFATALGRYH